MAYTGWLAGMRTTASRLNAISGIWTPYTPTWSSSTGAAVSSATAPLRASTRWTAASAT